MSRRPRPPFVELGCYVAGLTHDRALLRLLQRLGARPRTFVVAEGAGLRDRPFAGAVPPDGGVREAPCTAQQLAAALDDPDRRVVSVDVEDGLGVAPGALERLAVVETARPTRVHPVAVLAEERAFDGPAPDEERAAAAARVAKAFRRLVERVEPTYAAILVEQALPDPDALARRPSSDLTDVYLSGELLGVDEARALVGDSGATVEPLLGGVRLSCRRRGKALPREVGARLSVELSQRIAARLA